MVIPAMGESKEEQQRNKGIEEGGIRKGDIATCNSSISLAEPKTSPTINCFLVKEGRLKKEKRLHDKHYLNCTLVFLFQLTIYY